MRCVILDDFRGIALEIADWGSLGEDVEVVSIAERLLTDDAVVAALADAGAVVLMRERTALSAAILARLPKLELIVTTGMGNAVVDIEAARARGIEVCGTSADDISTAELVFAHILDLARGVGRESGRLHAEPGAWHTAEPSHDLRSATLGLLGVGRVGARVAQIGTAFGMNVIAWSDSLTEERARTAGVRRVGRDELFEQSDFVSVHLRLGERTRGLVGAGELRRMKPSAVLINTSRGPIVDETALIAALQGSWISAAALDVFDVEPLPADHPFRGLSNARLTPHIGYATERFYRDNYRQAVENIAAFRAGQPIRQIGV